MKMIQHILVPAYCCDLEERGKEIGVGVGVGDKNEEEEEEEEEDKDKEGACLLISTAYLI